MNENLKDIDTNIDNFITYLKLFENSKYTNSELIYFHINALCLLSELMNIVNEIYDNTSEKTDLFVKKFNEIDYDIHTGLMPKIESNFKKSYVNTLFYNDIYNYFKDKHDSNAISIKSALDYFAEYNSIKLIKILTNIMQFSIQQKYFDRIDNIKVRITELVKRIKLTISHESYDTRFSFNEETYREEILSLAIGYINREFFNSCVGKFVISDDDSLIIDNSPILHKPFEVNIDITIKNCDNESINNLTKEDREILIKSLMVEVNEKIMKEIDKYSKEEDDYGRNTSV